MKPDFATKAAAMKKILRRNQNEAKKAGWNHTESMCSSEITGRWGADLPAIIECDTAESSEALVNMATTHAMKPEVLRKIADLILSLLDASNFLEKLQLRCRTVIDSGNGVGQSTGPDLQDRFLVVRFCGECEWL